jgi:Zn-dependent peptidase ImmA (M78 family)
MREDIEKIVNKLVKKHKTRNPYILCEKLGIHIRYKPFKDLKGFYKKILKTKYIVLNNNLDKETEIIVLSHELGHAILHSNASIGFMRENFMHYNEILEKEANIFVEELLFNDDYIEKYLLK